MLLHQQPATIAEASLMISKLIQLNRKQEPWEPASPGQRNALIEGGWSEEAVDKLSKRDAVREVGILPPTEKELRKLASLVRGSGLSVEDLAQSGMNKKVVSAFIDFLNAKDGGSNSVGRKSY